MPWYLLMRKLITNARNNLINKESSCLKYWDVNNQYVQAMSQQLSVIGFKWIGKTSQFNEDFIRNYNEDNDEEYFLEIDVQYPQNLYNLHNDLPFLPEKMKN